MKLLVFDVEGTLFQTQVRLPGTDFDSTIWQGLAHALGKEAVKKEVETHHKWENGGYSSYLEWMKDTIRIHQEQKLEERLFLSVVAAAEYNCGVAQFFSQLDRSRFEPVLVTGGFRELAARPQRDFRIAHAFAACEYLFDELGLLNSFNLLPCDFEGKLDFVFLMLREYGLTDAEWVFVGDGRNDVPIAQRAPISIGYRPHAALAVEVDHVVSDFLDIQTILGSK